MNILVVNGPNLNLLGVREPEIYGRTTYDELVERIRAHAAERGVSVSVVQSNHEGVLVEEIQQARGRFDGLVVNAAAYTHTSVAILDALKAVGLPAVEVHLSEPLEREGFRRVSYAGMGCVHRVAGKGIVGYLEAMDFLIECCS